MSPLDETRHILRQALRLSQKIQSTVTQRKFRYNARELIDFYSTLPPEKSQPQLEAARTVLGTLDKILTVNPELARRLFRPFELIEVERQDPDPGRPADPSPGCTPLAGP